MWKRVDKVIPVSPAIRGVSHITLQQATDQGIVRPIKSLYKSINQISDDSLTGINMRSHKHFTGTAESWQFHVTDLVPLLKVMAW